VTVDDVYGFLFGLGLGLQECRQMTMYEVSRRFEQYVKTEERQWHKIRVLGAMILQPHSKKTIRPESLIPLRSDTRSTMSPEERKKDVEQKLKFYHQWQMRPS